MARCRSARPWASWPPDRVSTTCAPSAPRGLIPTCLAAPTCCGSSRRRPPGGLLHPPWCRAGLHAAIVARAGGSWLVASKLADLALAAPGQAPDALPSVSRDLRRVSPSRRCHGDRRLAAGVTARPGAPGGCRSADLALAAAVHRLRPAGRARPSLPGSRRPGRPQGPVCVTVRGPRTSNSACSTRPWATTCSIRRAAPSASIRRSHAARPGRCDRRYAALLRGGSGGGAPVG